MTLEIENNDWLRWIERLAGGSTVTTLPVEQPSALPRAHYYCRIDDQPDFLVPARLLPSPDRERASDRSVANRNWILNPQSVFNIPDSVEFDSHHFAYPSPGQRIVWVQDEDTCSAVPYWVGPELHNTLVRAEREGGLAEAIPENARFSLETAGILIQEKSAMARVEERHRFATIARNRFSEKGYVPVAHLIHPFHLSALRRYYRYHLRHGTFRLGDSQSSSRYVAFNEPVARFFHHQLTSRISEIVGESVKPSYCYFSSYTEGALLEMHTDREQCEFSVSLCIDYSPEPDLATPWPLRLHINGGQVQVFQALGDALLYRGREIPHSRGPLPKGHSSTSLFFHFVRQDFTGSLS